MLVLLKKNKVLAALRYMWQHCNAENVFIDRAEQIMYLTADDFRIQYFNKNCSIVKKILTNITCREQRKENREPFDIRCKHHCVLYLTLKCHTYQLYSPRDIRVQKLYVLVKKIMTR